MLNVPMASLMAGSAESAKAGRMEERLLIQAWKAKLDDRNTEAVALYSTMAQLTVQVATTVMSPGNQWELQGDWRFLLFNQKTYGLGTGPVAVKDQLVLGGYDGSLYQIPKP